MLTFVLGRKRASSLAQHSTIMSPQWYLIGFDVHITTNRRQLYTRGHHSSAIQWHCHSKVLYLFCLSLCLKVSSTTCVVPEQEGPPSMKMWQVTAVPSCSGNTQVCRGRLKAQSLVEQSAVEWRFCCMAQSNAAHLLWTAASCLWCPTKANWVSSKWLTQFFSSNNISK